MNAAVAAFCRLQAEITPAAEGGRVIPRMIGGDVTVTSEPGKGSMFTRASLRVMSPNRSAKG